MNCTEGEATAKWPTHGWPGRPRALDAAAEADAEAEDAAATEPSSPMRMALCGRIPKEEEEAPAVAARGPDGGRGDTGGNRGPPECGELAPERE